MLVVTKKSQIYSSSQARFVEIYWVDVILKWHRNQTSKADNFLVLRHHHAVILIGILNDNYAAKIDF